ncbi:MAG: chemotaxis protein CheB [Chloroflexota bacterium]|nr:chemotaxis protein CheB [Chloroflexota bacterium]
MPGHDIIVIGASAGGVEALIDVVGRLPRDLPAAVFVVLHLPAEGPTLLPEILTRAGPLPAELAENGAPIQHGRVLIAPSDHHLLVTSGHVHVLRGPTENGFRPAVDSLFRSAAYAYGPRTVGVVLTGMLDDGTAGLLAIKRRGGVAIVQDPAEALFPSMPASAKRYVAVDAACCLAEIPPMLTRLALQPVPDDEEWPMPENLELETGISRLDPEALSRAHELGSPSTNTCPACGGVLMEYFDGDLLRFRCQVGHAYSRESMFAMETKSLDRSLWAAYRALEERVVLSERLAEDAKRLNDHLGERRFRRLATEAGEQKVMIEQALDQQRASAD